MNFYDLEERIVWVDLEMTGLDIEKDKIMEIALLVTDSNLNILAEGPDIIIHQPEDVLHNMDKWCIENHGKSGLTEACLKSNVTISAAESVALSFLNKCVNKHCSPLAGNSVYMDRMFLRKFMPQLNDFLHYRIIDVSTIKELCMRWDPALYKLSPKKKYNHRALADIQESISELKFYKNHFFKSS